MPDHDGAPPDVPVDVADGSGASGTAAARDTASPPDEPAPGAVGGVDTAPAGDGGDAGDGADGSPSPPDPAVVAARLADLEAAVTALARRHDSESARAEARERVIERQHADIERMRTDERFGLLQPVLVDLCALRNDLLRQAATLPADLPVERMVALLESFAASVEETLLRCGVEVQPREVGAPFVPRRQRVAKVVEIDDPDRDGTVAEVVQDGYAEVDGGRVVVPARVAVHRAAGDRNATKEHVDA